MFNKKGMIILSVLCLTACRTVVNEGYISDEPEPEPGMDEGVRQIMMEDQAQYPEQEEGMIPAPSDLIRMY